MNRHVPKTLLITSVPPGERGVGESFVREMALQFPEDKLTLALFRAGLSNVSVSETDQRTEYPGLSVSLKDECTLDLNQSPGLDKHLHAYLERLKTWRQLKPLIRQTVEFARNNGVEQVLAIMTHPAIFQITDQIVQSLKVPHSCVVWDPPETVMHYLGYDKFSRDASLKMFRSLLTRASSVAVASSSMRDFYKAQLGIDGLPLVRPLYSHQILPTARSSSNELTIGFAGSTYATAEFEALLNTLGSIGWNLDGRPVKLRVLSNSWDFAITQGASIELHGYRPLEETISILSQCDVLYLPYWISPSFSLSAQVCFPDKLGTYVAAGTPVLYQGPSNTMPSQMVTQYNLGKTCNSLARDEILDRLRQLSGDFRSSPEFIAGRERMLKEQYDLENFKAQMARLISGRSIESDPAASRSEPVAGGLAR